MRAARIHEFGPPEVIVIDELPKPAPGPGEIVVRAAAAGVGPWDALIREGKSKVSPQPPLILGSDLSGTVEAVGANVTAFGVGDEVYGVTNPQFCGGHAEYAVASSAMMAKKPAQLNYVQSASVPVVAVTALQMVVDYAQVKPGQTILIFGAAGNVGAYAVQLAAIHGVRVVATAAASDADQVLQLGAEVAVDYRSANYAAYSVDAVLDTVGGSAREQAYRALKPGGIMVSVVSTDPNPSRPDVHSVFFYVDVTTERLDTISGLFAAGKLRTGVGTVLPLEDVREAHRMLAGAPHKSGKIVLTL
jgi:NADPH:quinone reductase-like Zn-dependent oxidoreductase